MQGSADSKRFVTKMKNALAALDAGHMDANDILGMAATGIINSNAPAEQPNRQLALPRTTFLTSGREVSLPESESTRQNNSKDSKQSKWKFAMVALVNKISLPANPSYQTSVPRILDSGSYYHLEGDKDSLVNVKRLSTPIEIKGVNVV